MRPNILCYDNPYYNKLNLLIDTCNIFMYNNVMSIFLVFFLFYLIKILNYKKFKIEF